MLAEKFLGENMALIRCPECKRDNISDTIEFCPHCGYSLRLHRKKIEELKKLKIELTKKIADIENTQPPPRPVISDYLLTLDGAGAIASSILAVTLAVVFVLGLVFSVTEFIVGPLIVFVPVVLFAKAVWEIIIEKYQSAKNDYIEKTDNRDQYIENRKRETISYYRERAKSIVAQTETTDSKNEVKLNLPQCPLCGSVLINRISAFDRSFSVALLGLASSKIGKQYECRICKHKW